MKSNSVTIQRVAIGQTLLGLHVSSSSFLFLNLGNVGSDKEHRKGFLVSEKVQRNE